MNAVAALLVTLLCGMSVVLIVAITANKIISPEQQNPSEPDCPALPRYDDCAVWVASKDSHVDYINTTVGFHKLNRTIQTGGKIIFCPGVDILDS